MYDVGIYGLWYGRNYGSIMTYFALSAVVRDMGLSVVMIENPLAGGDKREADFASAHPYHFSREQYDITEHYPLHKMGKLNDWCGTFLIGSDQMWNYALSKAYGQSYFLDFADDAHARVAYAASFGRMRYAAPSAYKKNAGENLKRFRAISVRDDFSKRILEDEFGIAAKKVLDPVLICEKECYETLCGRAEPEVREPYVLAYILDPSPCIGRQIAQIADAMGEDVVVVFNEGGDREKQMQRLGRGGHPHIQPQRSVSVYDWLWYFQNAAYVLTDSYHGTCFASIFNKPFITLKNQKRGAERFEELVKTLDAERFFVEEEEDLAESFAGMVHQGDAGNEDRSRLEQEKKESLDWLKRALMR